MQTTINFKAKDYIVDLSKPLDISIGLRGDEKNPIAWYLDAPKINPVKDGDFIGKVSEGASVNFNNIQFNPHAHGTHTECVGHISREFYSINQTLKTFFFFAKLISVEPETKGEDKVISEAILKEKIQPNETDALIIRTLPNFREKQTKKYSHTNWPYLSEEAAVYLRNSGIK
ncbi:MAG: cyclase family protein, partial [Salegentibacter mishustinae]|nr:cyclase family protein [Salegentibacter mishustinae]